MTDKQIKVGDVVAWDKVPSGALAREEGSWPGQHYAVHHGVHGTWVGNNKDDEWFEFDGGFWLWRDGNRPDVTVTIIAIDVPAAATADDLRELAEVFEVREAIAAGVAHTTPGMQHVCIRYFDDDATRMAGRLHAAGWRPGMTAEDAARLLVEAG